MYDCLRVAAEQPLHFFWPFEMALGVGREAESGLIDAAVLADACQHVHQSFAVGDMHSHVVGGDQRDVCLDRKLGKRPEAGCIVAVIATAGSDPDIAP